LCGGGIIRSAPYLYVAQLFNFRSEKGGQLETCPRHNGLRAVCGNCLVRSVGCARYLLKGIAHVGCRGVRGRLRESKKGNYN
jgi:hypothetical protein